MTQSSPCSFQSTHREALLEHLFAGEVMKRLWLAGVERLEVLKPQVDDGGYDLVLEANSLVRHIQLESAFRGSTLREIPVSPILARKPSGCLVFVWFDPRTLELGPFAFYGGSPGQPLPVLRGLKVAKPARASSPRAEADRSSPRVLPLARLEKDLDWDGLLARLFGPMHSRIAE